MTERWEVKIDEGGCTASKKRGSWDCRMHFDRTGELQERVADGVIRQLSADIDELRARLNEYERAPAVSFIRKWAFDKEVPKKEKNAKGRWAWPQKFTFLATTPFRLLEDDVELIARPARKGE